MPHSDNSSVALGHPANEDRKGLSTRCCVSPVSSTESTLHRFIAKSNTLKDCLEKRYQEPHFFLFSANPSRSVCIFSCQCRRAKRVDRVHGQRPIFGVSGCTAVFATSRSDGILPLAKRREVSLARLEVAASLVRAFFEVAFSTFVAGYRLVRSQNASNRRTFFG